MVWNTVPPPPYPGSAFKVSSMWYKKRHFWCPWRWKVVLVVHHYSLVSGAEENVYYRWTWLTKNEAIAKLVEQKLQGENVEL